jgi:CRP/FNR family transcriptional regulator, cyclic AMP receptor protein
MTLDALDASPSVFAALRGWPALAALADADVETVARGSRLRTYDRLAHVYWRGDDGDSLHVVVRGRIRLYVSTESGGELTVAVVAPGEFFGEMALFGSARAVNAQAVDGTETIEVTGDTFVALVRTHPAVAVTVMRFLCDRRRESIDHAADLALLDVHRRTVRALRRLSDRQRSPGSDETAIRLDMTQDDLARVVGTTRETLNRVLGVLGRAEIVRVDRPGTFIVNLALLQRTEESPFGD